MSNQACLKDGADSVYACFIFSGCNAERGQREMV